MLMSHKHLYLSLFVVSNSLAKAVFPAVSELCQIS